MVPETLSHLRRGPCPPLAPLPALDGRVCLRYSPSESPPSTTVNKMCTHPAWQSFFCSTPNHSEYYYYYYCSHHLQTCTCPHAICWNWRTTDISYCKSAGIPFREWHTFDGVVVRLVCVIGLIKHMSADNWIVFPARCLPISRARPPNDGTTCVIGNENRSVAR